MRAPLRPRELSTLILVSVFALAASGTHVVSSGESLGSVARDHGTTVRELVEANDITDPNLILVGQQLTIPGGGTGERTSSITHTVQRGETLAIIASEYGTTVRALAKANGIDDVNLIRVGQQLAVETTGGGAGAGGGAGGGSPASSGAQLPGQRHTVQIGDTIAGIAARYGIAAADLIEWNGLVDGKIFATTRLVLFDPGSLPSSQTTTSTASHAVASGETLGGIASRYGVRPAAIASASGLEDPNRIVVGQTLTIPGASGGFVCPVPGASFFNDWAFPRSGGRAHAGNDMFAPRGTPVLAPTSGWVDQATGRIGGHQFRLTDADGNLWFGSHLDSFGARGQVAAGDVIGYVGDSGNARGSRPHLHFEVHPAGTNAVNPYPLLRSSC